MRLHLPVGLLVMWCVSAHAGVQRDGTKITGDSYSVVLDGDATGVGGSLRSSGGQSAASRLMVEDADSSCTTATRACAIVIELPEWILRQCERVEQCADTDTTATVWQSFWSDDLTLATWMQWLDAGDLPSTQSLLSADLTTNPGDQIVWWQDPSASSQSAGASVWSVSQCTPPMAITLPTAAGTLHLAAMGWNDFSPATCSASAPGTELALELARAAPQTSTATTLVVSATLSEDPLTAVAALDRLLSTPTQDVTVGSRWMIDDDDLLDGLGLATLVIDTSEEKVVWTVAPAGGRTREDVRYLVRGFATNGRQPAAYRGGGEPLDNAVVRPLALASARVFNTEREWQPWQSGDTVCLQNNQWCYEAASPFPFSGLEVEIASPAADLIGDWQYWDGAAWNPLTVTAGSDAANLTASGTLSWNIPGDWQPSSTEVEGVAIALYAVRLRSSPGFSAGASLTAAAPDLLLFAPEIPIAEPTELRLTSNQRPIAATTSANVDLAVDETVRLDGTPSIDPEEAALTYTWQQSSGPATAELTSPNEVVATARLSESGLFVFELVVNDGDLDSAPAFVVVRAGTFVETKQGCGSTTASPWALVAAILALRRRQGRTVK